MILDKTIDQSRSVCEIEIERANQQQNQTSSCASHKNNNADKSHDYKIWSML